MIQFICPWGVWKNCGVPPPLAFNTLIHSLYSLLYVCVVERKRKELGKALAVKGRILTVSLQLSLLRNSGYLRWEKNTTYSCHTQHAHMHAHVSVLDSNTANVSCPLLPFVSLFGPTVYVYSRQGWLHARAFYFVARLLICSRPLPSELKCKWGAGRTTKWASLL